MFGDVPGGEGFVSLGGATQTSCVACEANTVVACEPLFRAVPVSAPDAPTLQALAHSFGWTDMSDAEVFDFMRERERLLRLAQDKLQTQKSYAKTAEEALLERITALTARGAAASSDPPSF